MHDTIIRLADVWKTCNKIRAAVFRVGLDLWQWYRPLDPEGNSLISESKFVSVLAGPLRATIGLSDAEIAQLADYFRAQDGRILYHQLCQLIHGEDPGREKTSSDCLLEACPPPPEPECHKLDQWQMRRLCCLLATIAQRDIPLRPYFQDYELVAKNDGRITFAHFARILDFIGIIVSPEDFNLLVRRFIKDSYTIDYVEFLKALEAVKKEGIQGLGPAYNHPKAVIDTTLPKLSRPEIEAGLSPSALGASEVFHPALDTPKPSRHLLELMMRVQQFVMQRRIRVSEFFRDYDPLNSGRIAPQQFRRALDAMGLGAVLSDAEARCVTRHYVDHNDGERVCWRTFEDDCDQVFAIKELEKHPEVSVGAAAAALADLPAPGAPEQLDSDIAPAEAALLRLRAACKERAIDLRPMFGDHDERSSGHVSRAQLRRVLARAGVLLAPPQLRALERRHLDDCGLNYFALLDELDEKPVESATIARAAPTRVAAARGPDPRETDIVQILAKIKGKIVREGVRPREFLRQFDTRRELVVTRPDFYRGLAAAGLALTPNEMDTLMEVFSAPGRRSYVEYEKFCEAAGEALAVGGLERAPLLQPVPHVPPPQPSPHLDYEERALVAGALAKLAKFPDQLSNILEVFKDADPQRCGSLPRSSLERALARRGLLELVSARERDVIYKCFGYRRGCRDEVNYRALCNALDILHATSSAQPC
ncbi:uncharacterized protein LOC123657546 [Melitaea cinxia]|uniref:uncharacterized protein LOC123657546 n=1 Tax=Melitaea cinxia TaxID=113334 RepID=UPI001E2700F0|nr:uncharacterized protein LOC123657546 [Melitaea cinxia]